MTERQKKEKLVKYLFLKKEFKILQDSNYFPDIRNSIHIKERANIFCQFKFDTHIKGGTLFPQIYYSGKWLQ